MSNRRLMRAFPPLHRHGRLLRPPELPRGQGEPQHLGGLHRAGLPAQPRRGRHRLRRHPPLARQLEAGACARSVTPFRGMCHGETCWKRVCVKYLPFSRHVRGDMLEAGVCELFALLLGDTCSGPTVGSGCMCVLSRPFCGMSGETCCSRCCVRVARVVLGLLTPSCRGRLLGLGKHAKGSFRMVVALTAVGVLRAVQ